MINSDKEICKEGTISIFTKRKIKQIFSKFPNWSKDDIEYLMFELTERKKILIATIERTNANQVRNRHQLQFQVEMMNEALRRLYFGKYQSPAQYELLEKLFCSYLKTDSKVELVGEVMHK
ncbi:MULTISPECIES: hypothetical protein [Paenibacillus]|nr:MULTISPECIES: hypothetical protein [Paenibacillus]